MKIIIRESYIRDVRTKEGGEGVQLNVGICRHGGKGVDQMWMSTFRNLVIKFLLKAVK